MTLLRCSTPPPHCLLVIFFLNIHLPKLILCVFISLFSYFSKRSKVIWFSEAISTKA